MQENCKQRRRGQNLQNGSMTIKFSKKNRQENTNKAKWCQRTEVKERCKNAKYNSLKSAWYNIELKYLL